MVEQRVEDPCRVGSSPTIPTRKLRDGVMATFESHKLRLWVRVPLAQPTAPEDKLAESSVFHIGETGSSPVGSTKQERENRLSVRSVARHTR